MGKNGTAYCLFEEQETTVQYSRVNNYATICTSDSTQKTRLNKLVAENPGRWEIIAKDEVFTTYRCNPKSLISFRGKAVKRNMTDEQKRAAAERLRNSRTK